MNGTGINTSSVSKNQLTTHAGNKQELNILSGGSSYLLFLVKGLCLKRQILVYRLS